MRYSFEISHNKSKCQAGDKGNYEGKGASYSGKGVSMEISIIIPVYNAEKYLNECLDSVILQTVKEKEIICIDDGSTDKSLQILEWYSKEEPNFIVLRQENKGPGEARNAGLKIATGKYVSFLDADDFYIDPKALEKMIYACESNHLHVCAGLRKVCRDGLSRDFPLYRDCFEEGKNTDGKVMRYVDYQDDYFYQNYIFSLKVIKENAICFPAYRRYEDPPFFLTVMMVIKEYIILPVEFYGYRDSVEAFSRKGLHLPDILSGIRDNMKTATENSLEELKKILIHRLDSEYAPWIVKNADKEIWKALCEIQHVAFGEARIKQDATQQETSLELMKALVAGNIKGNCLGAYFKKIGVSEVAVYGLGVFGEMAVGELKKASAITVYGTDKSKKGMEGVITGTIEEINEKCTDIIVTPLKNNEEIVREIEKLWKGRVWGLPDLIYKLGESAEA